MAEGEQRYGIAELAERRRAGWMRAVVGALTFYEIEERTPAAAAAGAGYRVAVRRAEGFRAPAEVVDAARQLGLRLVGVTRFRTVPSPWRQREVFLSEDGAVRLSARSEPVVGLAGQNMEYFLATTFDDGSAIVTWGYAPPPPHASAEGVESHAGTGDLLVDHAAHRAAVENRLQRTPAVAPVVAETVDDCVELGRYHDRYLCHDRTIGHIFWGSALVVMVVLMLCSLVLATVGVFGTIFFS
jgi:hypothetical protein